jgi:hypothetical protein
MQVQQQNPLTRRQKFQNATLLVKVILRATRQDSIASQIERELIAVLVQLQVPVQSIQLFKDRLEKVRQASPSAYKEDKYVMGGILIYDGILLQVLMGLGIPDFSMRIAWIAFAISFPCTVGFLLVLFLKEQNGISSHGGLHSKLAFFAGIGAVIMTTSLFFHIWDIAGWVFLLFALFILFGYSIYRFSVYYKPFLAIFRDILKGLQ